MAKMSKPNARKRCYSLIKNFLDSSMNREIYCDVVVESNGRVMILWNVPVRFHEHAFKKDEYYFTISIWWHEAKKQTGIFIDGEELPSEFDSRFISISAHGADRMIQFTNSWKTMLRCCLQTHNDGNEKTVLNIASEYETIQKG